MNTAQEKSSPLSYVKVAEQKRLNATREQGVPWKKWGPFYPFYGDDFKVECPTGSGNYMTLFGVAKEVARRLSSIFLRDKDGRRPVYGGTKKFQEDPHWRDYILFNEYFHGDNGAGLGASHQTGWTGIIARTLDSFARISQEDMLKTSKLELTTQMTRNQVAG